ncbi:MAG: amidohydrolase [Candidatus Humimicrobiaceae bacterium]
MGVEVSVIKFIDDNKKEYINLADEIWGYAELALMETKSVKSQIDFMVAKGFKITKVASCPTAFVAKYGFGKPVISLLGEYDALPGLSQAITPEQKPIECKASGHGCGHNLLGVGAMWAAVAVKDAMEKGEARGTICYYGCPAEETLMGKAIMIKEGLFNDVDISLTWHPDTYNSLNLGMIQAMNSFKFRFHGRASHAAGDPYNGRSALDAVELTNVGSNYMREHISKYASVHYVITNGGIVPNIVPDLAEVWYYTRAPKRDMVEEIYERVINIARGAALMTETKMELELVAGCYEFLHNDILNNIIWNTMEEIGPEKFTAEDIEFARKMTNNFPEGQKQKILDSSHLDAESYKYLEDKYLCDIIVPPLGQGIVFGGSTDVGNVSWIVPTAQFITACMPLGASPHSWQVTAASGMSIGHTGMVLAAKTLAAVIMKLYADHSIIDAVKAEFKEKTVKKGVRF